MRKEDLENIFNPSYESYEGYSEELKEKLRNRVAIKNYLENFGQFRRDKIEATIVGRLVRLRRMGKITFSRLADESGEIQIVLDEENFQNYADHIRKFVLGDLILTEGDAFITNTGEKSLRCKRVARLASCSALFPDKYHGIKDTYARRRDMVLELIANRETFEFFRKASIFISMLRMELFRRGFLEFQTPILRRKFCAGAARPFFTEHNAWDRRAYLRLTSEIELKQLLIAGYEKVFELGKSFRNEGSDRIHNPEFTLLEIYEAYADYKDMMALVEELVRNAILASFGTLKFETKKGEIDFSKPWKVVEARELCFSGIYGVTNLAEVDNMEKVERLAEALEIDVKGLSYGQAISKLLEVIIQPQIIQPTFVVHLPIQMSPFAKSKPNDHRWAERAWLFAGGIFFADIYSDLTDSSELLNRLKRQDEELGVKSDTSHTENDLVSALRYGAPPSAGIGLSIERLLMIIGNKSHVLDTILFPNS